MATSLNHPTIARPSARISGPGATGTLFCGYFPERVEGNDSTSVCAARSPVLVRESLVGQRTLLINTLRGHAAEFGMIVGKGPAKVGPLLTAIAQEATIPPEAKDMAVLLGRQIADLDARIKEIEVKLTAAHRANAVSRCLATILRM